MCNKMKFNKKQGLLPVFLTLAMASYSTAQARPADVSVYIDFEEFKTEVASGTSASTDPGYGILTKGYKLTPGKWSEYDSETGISTFLNDMHIANAVTAATDAEGFYPSNGSVIAAAHYDMHLERADGGLFSLYRFDFGGYLDSAGLAKESSFTVWGFYADGTYDYQDFTPDGVAGFDKTWRVGEWAHDLTDVMFQHWGSDTDQGSFALDNIHVSAVPVPAAIWLFGSGLAGLIGFARTRGRK